MKKLKVRSQRKVKPRKKQVKSPKKKVKSQKKKVKSPKKKMKTSKKSNKKDQFSFKKLTKLTSSLENCQYKQCKKALEDKDKINKQLYKAHGWNKAMTKLDTTKRDEKNIRKGKRLETMNNKKLDNCTKNKCKKQVSNYNKYYKKFLKIF